MKLSPVAGKLAEPSILVNVARPVSAYYSESPNPPLSEHGAKAELLDVNFEAGAVEKLKQ